MTEMWRLTAVCPLLVPPWARPR